MDSKTRLYALPRILCALAAALLFVLNSVTASAAPLVNGDFETGNFNGWTRYGFDGQHLLQNNSNHNYQNYLSNQTQGPVAAETNAVVTQQTTAFDGLGTTSPAINPTQGNFMAFLSNETSVGNDTLAGSAISQTFTIPVGATSLTYDVRFISNEALNSQWDFGGVALLNGTALTSPIVNQSNIDHDPAAGSIADAHITTTVAAGGFDEGTAWLSRSVSLSGLGGQNVTLVAYVTNTGDNSVESRILLDNIRVNIPEPTAFLLLVLGVFPVVASHRCNRAAQRCIE